MSEKIIQKKLFDNIYEPNMSLKNLQLIEGMFNKDIMGSLEIIGRDDAQDGKIIYHELASPNKILVWAKHCMTKLMSGDIMAIYGANRSSPASGNVAHGKGTFISNSQFFATETGTYLNDYNYIANDFTSYASMVNPYFPTKMLFGTAKGVDGSDYCATNDIDAIAESTIINQEDILNISNEGWVQSIHLSSVIGGIDNYGIATTNWSTFSNTEYSTNFKNWLPAFVFMKRSRPFTSGSEVAVDKYVAANYEYNKATYTVVLPSQLTGRWNPYNDENSGSGVQLKYAGLFCDAAWIDYIGNSENQNISSGSLGEKFQHGILWAKRAITPVIKSATISLEFIWNIYMPRES